MPLRLFSFQAGVLAAGLMVVPFAAQAHFGMLIPSASMVDKPGDRDIRIEVSFSHPFEQFGMPLQTPQSVSVTLEGQKQDLTGQLQDAQILGEAGFVLDYQIKRPGVHVFAMQPEPYWEPAEDLFIQHLTKTYVAAFGDDAGWDATLGLKTEIAPLSKPFGLWEGNVFQGQVLFDGQPVPFAEVEIEFLNTAKLPAPSELMITQTIKADANGIFTYAAPRAGWWGFSALSEADYTLDHEGDAKSVELGAVIWVKFESWPE